MDEIKAVDDETIQVTVGMITTEKKTDLLNAKQVLEDRLKIINDKLSYFKQ